MNICEMKKKIAELKAAERIECDNFERIRKIAEAVGDNETLLQSCFALMREYQNRATDLLEERMDYEYDLMYITHYAPRKKVSARLVDRLGVTLKHSGYNAFTCPTMDFAMDTAHALTNGTELSANIIDRETGEVLMVYEGGQVTWRDKSTLPDGEVIPVYELDYEHPYVKINNYVVFDLVDNKYYEPQTGSI